MTNQIQNQQTQAIANPKNIKDMVLNKVVSMQSTGGLAVPKGYDPTNALHNAWLQFEGNSKLMNTTDNSKANALLKMVALGLDPSRKQGYFIPYGNTVQFQESYHGNVHILKRDAGALAVNAQVVYEGDNFEYEIEPVTGNIKITKHSQTLESIDSKKPRAAYAVILFEDEKRNHTELMTYEQIKQAWLQSPMIKDEKSLEKSKTHNDFQEEMVKKTVINRAAKRFVTTTSVLTNQNIVNDIDQQARKQVYEAEIEAEQGNVEIDFDDNEHTEAEFREVPDNVNAETGEIIEEAPTENESNVMNEFTQKPVENMDEPPF